MVLSSIRATQWDKAGRFRASHFLEIEDFPRSSFVDQVGLKGGPVAYLVDDDYFSRSGARMVLEDAGLTVRDFADCETFLPAYEPCSDSCLVLDVHISGMGGLKTAANA